MKMLILALALSVSFNTFADDKCEAIATIAGQMSDASAISQTVYGAPTLVNIYEILRKKNDRRDQGTLKVLTAGVKETNDEVVYLVHTSLTEKNREVRPVSNYMVTLTKKDCLVQSMIRQK